MGELGSEQLLIRHALHAGAKPEKSEPHRDLTPFPFSPHGESLTVIHDPRSAGRGGISLTGDAPAKTLSCWSILYLFALFAAPAIDRMAG